MFVLTEYSRFYAMYALPRQTYDMVLRPETNNILTTTGFLAALRDVLRVRAGGLVWAGVPCNTQLGSKRVPG